MHGESEHPASSRKNCARSKCALRIATTCSFGINPRSSLRLAFWRDSPVPSHKDFSSLEAGRIDLKDCSGSLAALHIRCFVSTCLRAGCTGAHSRRNRRAGGRIVGARVVLSFLVFETGDDVGRTWSRDAKCSAPEIEVSVGTVHVAGFACQTLVVTNEQMALLSQVVHQLPNGRPCACCLHCQQGFKFIDVASCTTFGRDVFATPIPMRSAFLDLRSRFRSGSNRFVPLPPRLPRSLQACGGSRSCFA